MRLLAIAVVGLACLLDVAVASAQPGLTRSRFGVFREPVYLTAPAGSSRLFVVERRGRIRVVRPGQRIVRRPFLDIRRDVYIVGATQGRDQRGLLSMAFAPDYARTGRFYVMYSARDDTMQVDEFRRSSNPERADPTTRRAVINVGEASPYHHGGQLQFGPDGFLYISTGITHTAGLGQDLGDLHGKILRIDPRQAGDRPYSIPADNPFIATPGARPEIYLYGLRNPWRFSFDRRTGDMAIGDVGEETAEEVDFLPRGTGAGANFGWDVFEGRTRVNGGETPPGYVPPVIAHRHDDGFCSVIGGYVVRDRALRGLYGRYLYADLCRLRLRSAILRAGRARSDRSIPLKLRYIVSFGEDSRGRIYAVNFSGYIFRLVYRRR